MAFFMLLAVLVVVSELLWRSLGDRMTQSFRESVSAIEARSSSLLHSQVWDRFGFTVIMTPRLKISLSCVGEIPTPKLMAEYFLGLGTGQVRSVSGPRYVFAVIVPRCGLVLVHRYAFGPHVDPHDQTLRSILGSLQAVGMQLKFKPSNVVVKPIEDAKKPTQLKRIQEVKPIEDGALVVKGIQEENALSSSQNGRRQSHEDSKQLFGFTVIMTPCIRMYLSGVAEGNPTPKLMKDLFRGLGTGQTVRSLSGSRYVFAVTVPAHGLVLIHRFGFKFLIDPHDKILPSILLSFRAVGRQLSFKPNNEAIEDKECELSSIQAEVDDLAIDMDLEEDNKELPAAIMQAIYGNIIHPLEVVDMSIDMDLEEDDEELPAAIMQGIYGNNVIHPQAEVVVAPKEITVKKKKLLETEEERKRREKVLIKEARIEEARKRRAAHFNEKRKNAGNMGRYSTNQTHTSKTNAFGFSKGFRAKFRLIKKIGSGGFGTVYKARYKNDVSSTKPFVAVKVMDKSEFSSPSAIRAIKIEAQIMEKLSGKKGMLTFHGAYEDSKRVYFVMELCEGGTLFRAHQSRNGHYTENEARFLVKQILCAVKECHRNKVLHRDLKLENFLCVAKDDYRSIRLIDFGLSEIMMPGKSIDDIAGSPGLIAPEVFEGSWGFEADCWSVGVMACYILTKDFPFPLPQNETDTWRPDLAKGPDYDHDILWRLVPKGAQNFVKGLLEPNPDLRMTLQQALRHEYMRGCTDYGQWRR